MPPLTVAPPEPPQEPVDDDPVLPERTRKSRGRLIAAAVAAAALVVAAIVLTTSRHDHGNSGAAGPRTATPAPSPRTVSTPATATPVRTANDADRRAAVAWISANLPQSTAILADPASAARLTAAGFSAVDTSAAGTTPAYVVSATALNSGGADGELRARSVPVARFGAVTVLGVLRGKPGTGQALLAADLSDRRAAGKELATNPAVLVDDTDRAALAEGALDLRAATFLALVAADSPVHVTALPAVAAETAVGRPRRTLVLSTSGAAGAAVRRALGALPADYAPSSVSNAYGGSITVTWRPTAQPVRAIT